jgi:predicted Zn-ribbon and HTH transcriptional regulator
VLRATKIVLTELAAIRGSNSQLRLSLARNCDECIFEFFNRCAGRPARSRWCKSTAMKE